MPMLVDLQRAAAATNPAGAAVVGGGRSLTFAEFDALTDCAAAGLAARGIAPGDRVGLYCINADAFAVAYFGILKAGATVVPLNLLFHPKEIAFILGDAGARALIYHEAMAANVAQLGPDAPALRLHIGATPPPPGVVSWRELLSSSANTPPPQHPASSPHSPVKDENEEDRRRSSDSSFRLPPSALAAILYTSGTTGYPKGAMLTHANLAANAGSIREALGLRPGSDVILVVLPMFHAFAATVGLIAPLVSGCTLVPLPKFEPQLVADTVAAHRVTILPLVPSMYAVLLGLPDDQVPKFASVRFCVSGGAAMPEEVMRRFEAKFGTLIYEGDGPTECSPCTCCNPIGGRRKPRSVGPALPGVEMRIVDERGQEKPRGEIGEICVRGANVMKGYWNRPDDTAAAFFGDWFRTGDLGYEDEDRYFFIVDRIKDLIIVNGMNVYPRILEECLYRHPAVREAAVIGEPDALHGEIPVAFVSLRPGAAATAAELRAYCRDHLGRHEIPRRVHVRPDLPKNAAGKILKRELRPRAGEAERGVT